MGVLDARLNKASDTGEELVKHMSSCANLLLLNAVPRQQQSTSAVDSALAAEII